MTLNGSISLQAFAESCELPNSLFQHLAAFRHAAGDAAIRMQGSAAATHAIPVVRPAQAGHFCDAATKPEVSKHMNAAGL